MNIVLTCTFKLGLEENNLSSNLFGDWLVDLQSVMIACFGTPFTTPMFSMQACGEKFNDLLTSLLRSGVIGCDVSEPAPDDVFELGVELECCKMNCTSFEYSPHFISTCRAKRIWMRNELDEPF